MNKQVMFPPLAIKQIANVMAIQNPSAPNYLKGPELVNLFNALGYPDNYTFEEGRGIQTLDYGEGLSRLNYTTKRLEDLNKASQIPDALQEFTKRIRQPLEFIETLQKVLKPWNLDQFVPKNGTEALQVDNANIDKTDAVIVESPKNIGTDINPKNEETEKLYDARKKALEESVLGKIPGGHPVVFISYSWDSEEHQTWVLKLSEDLAKNGIYVLLDQYVEDGSMLPAYMDLGLDRANKVLIIGTEKYRMKCYEPSSGVAFEDCIIRNNISQNIGTKKFIACLRQGDFKKSFPIYIGTNKGHDFSKEEDYDKELESLCRAIYGKPLHKRPQLGEIPDYAKK